MDTKRTTSTGVAVESAITEKRSLKGSEDKALLKKQRHSVKSIDGRTKVAYIVSRFPKITETFILYEMLAVEQQLVEVELYPLLRERTSLMHQEAIAFVERAHFTPFISWSILRAHLYYLDRKPLIYLNTLWTILRENWGSFRFFFGGLGIFPKSVYFARVMESEGINHVHAHFASHPAAAAYIIHCLTGIPFSFTAHGSDLHRDRHMLQEKVSKAAFVVAISEYNKNLIIAECNGKSVEKIKVIHCGVDTRVFVPQKEEESSRENNKHFMILCIGTLHEVKGQTYLIQACQLLHERGLEFTCHFAGDGPDEGMLKGQVLKAGLSSRVEFHGQLTREEIRGLLCQADVLATPSVPTGNGRREGIPVVLMEAMSSAVPVVASEISGIPELVTDGENGLLVPPGDGRALANALKRLYQDSIMRSRFGKAGREKVLAEFDLNKNAARLTQHFNEEVS